MSDHATQCEHDLTFVDNEEGFDVLKRPYQRQDRDDVAAGRKTVDDLSSFRSGYFKHATLVFQDHDEAF